MELVLVHWYVKPDCESDFFCFRKPLRLDTVGFHGEILYRQINQSEPGAVEFVNVGRWRSKADFDAVFPPNERRDQDFEFKPRFREWLTLVETD